jgi:arabinogalactan endo-1,4-beta-galactosidase
VLKDSIYNYTKKVLRHLASRDLLPEMVQIGNETNCGFLYSDAPAEFPRLNGCEGNWARLGEVFNSAIKAVRDESNEIRIVLHIADPANAKFFFNELTSGGAVTDFDIIGLSFYPLWHTSTGIHGVSGRIAELKTLFDKDVMIVETAYPWTTDSADDYNNLFGSQAPIEGYPFSVEGQQAILEKIVTEVRDGGGIGVVYWEPAWITSELKDRWGSGSSWENVTLFNFQGELLPSARYLNGANAN